MNILDIFKGSVKQINSLRRLLIYIYAPIFLLFLMAGIFTQIVPDLSIQDFLRDVAIIGEIPFYSGSISQLGLLLWSATTTVCFFTYFALKKIEPSRKQSLNLLMFGGFLSGYLMLDDTFMLHEEFFLDYIIFIPEKAILLLLGIAMVSFIFFNRQEILRGEYGLLFLSYLFLGISVFFDAIPNRFYENIEHAYAIESYLEDGAKFIGITTWLVFFARYSYQQFLHIFSQKP